MPVEPAGFVLKQSGEARRNLKTFLGQGDCRLEEIGPVQPAISVVHQFHQAWHARDADRSSAHHGVEEGERLALVELLLRATELGRRHGVGIVDQIEDRIVGLKVRDLYEVPAAAIVLTAHQELERLVSTIHQNQFKASLDRQWAYLCYAGLWHDPLRHDLDAFMDSANSRVTGEVALRLFKGSVTPLARSSPYALYDRSLASFGESGGGFSQQAGPGFVELFTLQSRLAHRLGGRDGFDPGKGGTKEGG